LLLIRENEDGKWNYVSGEWLLFKVLKGVQGKAKVCVNVKRKELSMQQAMGIFCGFRAKSP
jgi:hypothetical protein